MGDHFQEDNQVLNFSWYS